MMMELALLYASRGWKVFPCHGAAHSDATGHYDPLHKRGNCTCSKGRECDRPAKHPRTEHGLKDASSDGTQIKAWWGNWRHANIGMATGEASGFWVLDCDGAKGRQDLHELVAEHGDEGLLDTLLVHTGGGGMHLLFAMPAGIEIKNGDHLHGTCIDVRGTGGYIIAAGSRHANGRLYYPHDDNSDSEHICIESAAEYMRDAAILPAPDWLVQWVTDRKPKQQANVNGNGHAHVTGQDRLLAAASQYVAKAAAADEGHRNGAAFSLAGHLVAFVGDDSHERLNKQQICDLMRGWNCRNRPPLGDSELESAIDSALRGNGTPRPPKVVQSKPHAQRGGNDDGERQQSQATVLVDLALSSGAEFFHDPSGEAYCTVHIGSHRETWRVRSKACKLWLWRLYHQHSGKSPNAQAVSDALCGLESRALFDGVQHAVYLRTAEHGGKVYIDLCDDGWQAAEIDADGWRVVSTPPVRFRRAKAMLPLPIPRLGGQLDALRQYINVDVDGWSLAAAWLVAAVRPRGPYPVLALTAEQGAGKSTVARLLRSIVDPSTAPIRCEPRDPRDLMIAANNGWLVALDNLSHVPTWLSDALCRLATGGGFSTRTLYENDEETIFDAMRPVLLTGIEDYVTRGDLLDRSLVVSLPAIPEHQRRPEAELWQAWERDRPRMFGALLTAVAAAMARLPDVHLDRLPRMADFALWAAAAEPALGIEHGAFVATYAGNRESAVSMVLDDSLVAVAVRQYMADKSTWEGTAAVLLGELSGLVSEADQRSKRWVRSPRGLAGQLRRLAPALRMVGIDVSFERQGRGNDQRRTVRIEARGNCGNG